MNAPSIDWPSALRRGLQLGLPPREFWSLSLAEWRALTTGSAEIPAQEAIERLRCAYPDRRPENRRADIHDPHRG